VVERPDGFDEVDFASALAAYEATANFDDAIDQHPAVSSPLFHSELRRRVTRAGSTARDRYDELFRVLHERAYRCMLRSAAGGDVARRESRDGGIGVGVSPFFSSLLLALEGRVPGIPERPFDPASERSAIEAELTRDARPPVLPPHAHVHGVRWGAIVVTCPRCRTMRVIAHAHLIDLVAAPELRANLDCINRHHCEACGVEACEPNFVWVREGRGAADPLNSVATLIIAPRGMAIYRSPPATVRDWRNDRVLEIRADKLRGDLDVPVGGVAGVRDRAFLAIAYSAEEVEGLLAYSSQGSEWEFAMETVIRDYAHKLETGLAAPTDSGASSRVASMIPTEAPIAIAPELLPDHPHLALAFHLAMEARARSVQAAPALLAELARQIARAHIARGEHVLAEVSAARAADIVSKSTVRGDDPVLRAELLVKQNDYVSAERLLRPVLDEDPDDSTFLERCDHHQVAAYHALTLFRTGRLPEAFQSFRTHIAALEKLVSDVPTHAGADARVTRRLQAALSAALANFSFLLFDLSDQIELPAMTDAQARTLNALPPREAEALLVVLRGCLLGSLSSPDDAKEHIIAVLAGPSDATFGERVASIAPPAAVERIASIVATADLWSAHFQTERDRLGGVARARAMRQTAMENLARALVISESVGDWRHAARQAYRLAAERSRIEGQASTATSMERVASLAARGGDQRFIARAHAYLAGHELSRGDAAAGLRHARLAARAVLKLRAAKGDVADDETTTHAIADTAIRCAAASRPQSVEGVVIAESLKAPALALSMERGVDFLRDAQDTHFGITEAALREERETIRAEVPTSPDAAPELAALDDAVDRMRHESLVRDERFGRWCEIVGLDISTAAAFMRRIARLGPNTTYVGFLAGSKTIWTYAVWRDGCIVDERPSPPASDAICLVDASDFAETSARVLDRDRLSRWAETLLIPLAARLRAVEADDTIIVSLDPPLDRIPFAALPFDGVPLCERARLGFVNGAGAFDVACRRPRATYGSILCFGNPSRPDTVGGTPEEVTSYAAAARGAADEVAHASELFSRAGRPAVVRVEEEATVGALIDLAPQADAIHFACHAEPESDSDPSPRLLLSPARESGDRGDLTGDRVLRQLDLKEGCLVNLAACESAHQREAVGPRAHGLVPAFLIKGAGAVIGTLWPISSREAAKFTREFYKHLLDGDGAVASLTETQRACIAGELGAELAAPESWSAYVVFGVE